MEEEQKEGAPAWMISFGDMMTLILTFFILLVSMSKERQVGLKAKGVGSFAVAMQSFGLSGVLDGAEEPTVSEETRSKFRQPEGDPDRDEPLTVEQLELLQAETLEALKPVRQFSQPSFAVFDRGSAELTGASMSYIDLLIPSLTPGGRALLQLEGHAAQNEPGWKGRAHELAFQRALAVQTYLVEKHEIKRYHLKPRVWLREIEKAKQPRAAVDARLTIPSK